MERQNDQPESGARAVTGLLEGLNLDNTERSLGGSLWSPETAYQPQSYNASTTGQNTARGYTLSPTMSTSRAQPRQPRRTTSNGLEVVAPELEPTTSIPQFDPPSLRSIFASGPPTASLSVNTAQASMSTASPGISSRPFAGLTNATVSATRRRDMRSIEIANLPGMMNQHANFAILNTEKDVDDPTSMFANPPDNLSSSTSRVLSNLFVTSDRSTPNQLSRQTTHRRSTSHVLKTLNDTSTLTGHLLQLGFEDGRHSDITIKAFGRSYRLHKLLLDRVPYFSTAFCGVWAESSASEMTLVPEDIDPNITQTAFELAIRRIYGTVIPFREEQEAIGLFATGCWLDMPDLVESCIENILRQMQPFSLHVLIKLVTNNYYGKAGDRILSSAKAMLFRDGWEMPYDYWDNIPADIIREIIGGDPFYVPSEWERWYLTLKLLNRRLRKYAIDSKLASADGKLSCPPSSRLRASAVRSHLTTSINRKGRPLSADDKAWVALYSHPEIAPLLSLLDEGIHYVHLRFEQLQIIRSQNDILGVPLMTDKVISDALWMSMELRQRVLNAREGDLELGLSELAETEDDEEEEDNEDDDDGSTPVAETHSSKGKQREESIESVTTTTESVSASFDTEPRRFWIPNNDVSCVMGGSHESYATATFASPTEPSAPPQRSTATPEITDLSWAADLGSSLFDTSLSTPRNLVASSLPRCSNYPPFRFCAEFPHPRTLKERKRVYSHTVWYAGSLWNLYIQRVNTSKNQQLGVYLHRAKDREPTEDTFALTVDDRIGQLEREMLMRRGERRYRNWHNDGFNPHGESEHEDPSQNSLNDYEPSHSAATGKSTTINSNNNNHNHNNNNGSTSSHPHKTSQSPLQIRPVAPSLSATNSSQSHPHHQQQQQQQQHNLSTSVTTTIPMTDSLCDPPLRPQASISTIPPYTDARTTIKTYFKIYSPSKGGRLLSVYESAPDSFNFGKSWGWKSSWMVLEDGLDGGVGIGGGSGIGGIGGGGGKEGGTRGQVNSSGTIGDGKLRYMVVIGNV